MLGHDLPSLRAILRLGDKKSTDSTPWFDVKFLPGNLGGDSPVFAITGGNSVLVCRCVHEKENSIEVLQCFEDQEPDVQYNSVAWSRAANGDPLVCVTGLTPKIKILNVKTGEFVTTLTGHGDAINDLAVSPVDHTCLASASNDNSVRIWTLDPTYEHQPTAAIAYGAGHDQQVLALGWHRKGRYLLSGGMDTRLNLWVIPDDVPKGTDKPPLIHYPHFSSTEIHTDFIDCVQFHNDSIFSRASKEHKILLWKIENFDSSEPPPAQTAVPTPSTQTVQSQKSVFLPASQVSGTRSAWGGRFQRLLQFDLPNTELFYIRFGLFHPPGKDKHPILAAGNQKAKLHFWDLQELEEAGSGEPLKKSDTEKERGRLPLQSASLAHIRESSEVSSASFTSAFTSAARDSSSVRSSSTGVAMGMGSAQLSKRKGKGKKKTKPPKEEEVLAVPHFGIGDPFRSITAHKMQKIPGAPFVVRQVAFSPSGEWCVACGDNRMIAIFSTATVTEDGMAHPGGA